MMRHNEADINRNYQYAKEVFAQYGVDTDQAIAAFKTVPISIHSWAGDDVKGFEHFENVHSENTVTGNYPGAARNGAEMRRDLEMAMKFSPCAHRLGLQSMYAEPQTKKERNEYSIEDYRQWIDFAKAHHMGVDYNTSYFTHPMMKDGCSLASPHEYVREYWIQAGIAGRKFCADVGRELGTACINNTWVPDGTKDNTSDRMGYRTRLRESLDRVFAQPYDKAHMRDCMEGKVFSIGNECFTVGSHDFYIAYAAKHNLGLTIDTGHFHPTENFADKITAVYPFVDYLMFHLSRGVRWDSDHTLILDDSLQQVFQELKRADVLGKNVGLGLDFFDATMNRVSAWVIGLRASGKALLTALLEPTHLLREADAAGNFGKRLALTEACKDLPVNAVWDYVCMRENAGVGTEWIDDMDRYETEVLSQRI